MHLYFFILMFFNSVTLYDNVETLSMGDFAIPTSKIGDDFKFGTKDKVATIAADYNVGPGQPLSTISEVPWATLQAGDRVFIHWKSTPYKEKWVINRQGTASERIQVIGVSGPQGQKPVIDGNGAATVAGVNFWNEQRGVIKIGGSNTPADGLPNYITIENLEIKSGRPQYQFTDDNGQTQTYSDNAAAIYVEKGANLIIRNCTLSDSGNGLFIGASGGASENILIENNYILDNGIVGSFFQHNTYTEAVNITYQYNRFGPLRVGATGNNLKDRSAGLVVRNNWIEGGNRQLDLVDAGSQNLINHPNYNMTFVYGNILIEPDGAGNSQIVHYGGDSGSTANYRKGNLYFYNNTVISTRAGNTTLIRLSTNDETAEVFNNTIFTTALGSNFAMFDNNGTFNLDYNWLKSGWKDCHCGTPSGTVNDLGNNILGTDPLFVNFGDQNFYPQENSPLINQGNGIPATLLPDHSLSFEYVKHQGSANRNQIGNMDIGAFEYNNNADDNKSVGIGTTSPQGVLDVVSTNSGIILPRISDTTVVVSPVSGMLIYDLSEHCVRAYQNGFWSNCFGN